MPKARGGEERGEEADAPREKLSPQKVHPENREDAEERGGQPEYPRFVNVGRREEDGLDIHKEPLAAVILGVVHFKITRAKCLLCIRTVHRLIGIETRRRGGDVVEPEERCYTKDANEQKDGGSLGHISRSIMANW